MNKPRIFLGSSGKQAKLLQSITRGLEEVADVEPWTTTFNPGRSTLDRLVELSQEVDFAAFVFAQDDWTTTDRSQSGQASRSENEPSAVSLLRISRDRDGGLNVSGRAWQEDGTLSARYWSEAAKERRDPAGILYFWKGERPRHADAPQLEGVGEIRVETADRATGYWTTRSDRDPGLNARTAGIYLRADPSDLQVLEGGSEEERARLIAQRLLEWKSAATTF